MTADATVMRHISQRAQQREVVGFHGVPLPDHVNRHLSPISLSGGRPHEGFYPLTKITYEFKDRPFGEPRGAQVVDRVGEDASKLDLKRALNYGPTEGFPQLLEFAKDLVSLTNKPGYSTWDVTLTNGSGDSLHKVFNLLLDPGDTVLLEAYTFVPTINTIGSWGGSPVPVPINFEDGGIDVDYLEQLLEGWFQGQYQEKPFPKVLYTIPTGQNPTGLSLKESKRERVYGLAKKYDFIIVEDDPYGYIQLGAFTDGVDNPFDDDTYDSARFVKERLLKSYIQYDSDGRVLRLETFSKVFAPGARLGFIVGHSELIRRIIDHSNISTKAPSGLSQVSVLSAIVHSGGARGWIEWCVKVSKVYTERKNVLIRTLLESEAYKKGYFKYNEADAGMFITIDLNLPEGDDHRLELESFRYKAIEKGVEVVLGKNMAFTPEYAKSAKFIRLTLATASDNDELIEAARRLSQAVLSFFEQ